MRADFCFTLLLLTLARQASTTLQEQERKLSTQHQPSVDYDPNSRTALLNINIEEAVLSSGLTLSRQSPQPVNNVDVQVLRWLTNSTECRPIETCKSRMMEDVATVLQSHRICWASDDMTTTAQYDKTIPAGQRQASVLLDHIYTGCYCFRLDFYHDDTIQRACQLLEQPLYLYTDVVEYDVFKWNLSLDLSATSQHDLSLFIKLHDASEFRFYNVQLFRHDDIDDHLMECGETDDPINNQYLNISFPDHAIQEWQVVTFQNLSYGYYCVVVIPDDDRCDPPLIDPDKTCARYSNIVQLREKKTMVLTHYSEMDIWFYLLACVAVTILSICVIIRALLKRKMNPNLIVDDFHSPADILLKQDVTTSTEIPILFLYSNRSINRLAHHVSHLKEAIRNYVPNGKVLDEADDIDLAAIEGVEWFSNHLQVAKPNHIRIVIFLCSEMMRCQEWFLRSKSQADYGDVDQVCCYRLNQLFHHIDENNVYRQVFAIRFDDDLIVGNRSSSSFCLLTPYRSYRWPHDELALLKELGEYLNR
ncbi:uncharacterized protein LOC130693061 [Daphnia carinata]|uniref:uncharacterized protein LOC130693061 n=1 Tax=Daphnia carinata TaxID=120202 RepID=UPI00257C1B23|nr:uncharacterized protein LOC130693061 [Daphnia carinata]